MNRFQKVIAAVLFCLIPLHFFLYWYKCGHFIFGSVYLFGGFLMMAVIAIYAVKLIKGNKDMVLKLQWMANAVILASIAMLTYLILSWDVRALTKDEKEFIEMKQKESRK